MSTPADRGELTVLGAGPPAPDTQPHPPHPAASTVPESLAPATLSNVDAYLGNFRLSGKFNSRPAVEVRPVISVPVNFEALRTSFINILSIAYLDWSLLRSQYTGNEIDITNAITIGISNLASAMVLQIYNMLRYQCGVYDSQNQIIYRTRCHYDMGATLPSGASYLVEQFGFSQPSELHFNPKFIHRWDHQYPATFGLTPEHALNNQILTGFNERLASTNVPFRRIDKYVLPRNSWDSLYIRQNSNGHDVFTTFPSVNYDLPRDVFLSIGICQDSTLVASRPIQYYPPRLGILSNSKVSQLVKTIDPAPHLASDNERLAMPALGVPHVPDDTHMRINGHLTNMHMTGANRRQTGIDPAANVPTFELDIYIYGRGGATCSLIINSVARGVTYEEVAGYYRALLRTGP